MRPVLRGVFRMESLIDGTLDLEHVALANAALDAQDENERRWRRHNERQAP
jgi:hypothetical protein